MGHYKKNLLESEVSMPGADVPGMAAFITTLELELSFRWYHILFFIFINSSFSLKARNGYNPLLS